MINELNEVIDSFYDGRKILVMTDYGWVLLVQKFLRPT